MGYMVLDYGVFDFINEGDVFEKDPLIKLSETENLYAYQHSGFFEPMDTYRENLALNKLWNQDKAPWKME